MSGGVLLLFCKVTSICFVLSWTLICSKFGSMSSPGGGGKLELYCDGYGKFGQVLGG